VLPLLASCLILALIAGTLLTFFTARPSGDSAAGTGGTAKASSASPPAASGQGSASGTPDTQGDHPQPVLSTDPFPAQAVLTVGQQTVTRSDLTDGTVFVLVPVGCNCGRVLAEMVSQAADTNVVPYIVGGGKLASAAYINAQLASANAQGGLGVAVDARGTLANTYLPAAAIAPGSAPSALLVAPDGTVSVAMALPDGFRLNGALRALSAQASAAPAASDN
jgi:hypothetical protein